MHSNFLSVFLLVNATAAFGTNYYLSENGNDSYNGRSPKKAWQNLSRLNLVILKAGDSILLECNGRFEGALYIQQSGTANKPIVIAAYGNGKPPVITGASVLKVSNSENGSLYLESNHQPFAFFINNIWQQPARYPNSGYLPVGIGVEYSGFNVEHPLPNEWYRGATIRMRTIDWVYENRKIASAIEGVLKMDSPSRYRFSPGYGYFLEGNQHFLDTTGEWHFNGKTIEWKSKNAAENIQAEATIYQNGITLKPGTKYISISGINLEKFYGYGVHIGPGSANITIRDCGIQKIGNIGVYADTLTSNITVRNSRFEDIDGRGFSAIRTSNSNILNNKFFRIGMNPGYGISGVNGMIAIVIENNEKVHTISNSHHNRIAYNYIDSNGYAGIRMDGSNSICEFNIVKNSSLKLNDAGAIYCFAKVKNRTYDNIIRNNLIINVTGNVDATPNNPFAANGIYLDNKSTGILVENNTILKVVSSGIMVNDDAPRNTIQNNLVMDAASGIGFAEWATKDSLYGCTITGNTLVPATKSQKPVSLLSYLGPEINPGMFDNNIYVNAHDGYVVEKRTDPEPGIRRRDDLKLKAWQLLSGEDKHSRSIERKHPEIIYNDSFTPKKISFAHGSYTDIEGSELTGELTLPPCGSKLVFKTTRN